MDPNKRTPQRGPKLPLSTQRYSLPNRAPWYLWEVVGRRKSTLNSTPTRGTWARRRAARSLRRVRGRPRHGPHPSGRGAPAEASASRGRGRAEPQGGGGWRDGGSMSQLSSTLRDILDGDPRLLPPGRLDQPTAGSTAGTPPGDDPNPMKTTSTWVDRVWGLSVWECQLRSLLTGP